jgi:hypothetical protein
MIAPDTDRVERMTTALNQTYVPLSDDSACRATYVRAGIKGYSESDHGTAWEEALHSRCFVSNLCRQLPSNAGEGEV